MEPYRCGATMRILRMYSFQFAAWLGKRKSVSEPHYQIERHRNKWGLETIAERRNQQHSRELCEKKRAEGAVFEGAECHDQREQETDIQSGADISGISQ